ncbi:Transcription elongation factor SPT4 [Glutinoglossum americanum]|uniref:Transcription elongation factor SPT4 n=1 Tax=Glutinoglossum americanum TaxID=1670608 RepID=A0A9P8L227_9PEZI|nr:Transcription elongation factor SPT4 [Glutinoglossum americanum]
MTSVSHSFVAPGQQKNLRACMVCSIVQLQSKFLKEGCPNCEGFLSLAHSQEAVEECTSQVYEGLIALADPAQSWVAKWQRLDGYVKGVYAVKVMGTLPEEVLDTMAENNIHYTPRDGSASNAD